MSAEPALVPCPLCGAWLALTLVNDEPFYRCAACRTFWEPTELASPHPQPTAIEVVDERPLRPS